MDQQQFDRIARLLGSGTSRRAGLRAAVGAVLGLGAAKGLDPLAVDAAKQPQRRHEKLPCRNQHSECIQNDQCCSDNCVPTFGGTGFRCAAPLSGGGNGKKGKNRNNGGNGYVRPQGWPCSKGQRCERGTCLPLDPVSGAPAGIFCAAYNGDSCSSDYGCVSFYCDPETLTCAPRTPAGESCDEGTVCAADASCTFYDDEGAPDGDYCLQPYGTHCAIDEQCASYHCSYPSRVSGERKGGGKKDRRGARAASERVAAGELACCGMTDQVCNDNINCCDGWVCRGDTCRPNSIPTGEACTQDDVCADRDALCTTYDDNDPSGTYCLLLLNEACVFSEDCVTHECTDNVCAVPIAEHCTKADTCGDPDAHCLPYRDHVPAGTYCLLRAGDECEDSSTCSTHSCTEGICTVITGDPCGAGDTCANEDASCTGYIDGSPSGDFCLLPAGSTCAANNECETQVCENGVCLIPLQQPCDPDGDTYCQGFYAICTTYSSDQEGDDECLQEPGGACGSNADCISEFCQGGICVLPVLAECLPGDACADGATCTTYDGVDPNPTAITPADAIYFCLFPARHTCNRNAQCASDLCAKGRCRTVTHITDPCVSTSECPTPSTCSAYDDNTPAGTYCLLADSYTCGASDECMSHACISCACCPTSGSTGLLGTWGSEGNANDQLDYPQALAFTPDGLQLLIIDANNDRVALWTRPAACSSDWSAQPPFGNTGTYALQNPKSIAIASDGLTCLVTDLAQNMMLTYRRTPGGIDWAYVTNLPSDDPDANDYMRGVALSPDDLTMVLTYEGTSANFSVYTRANTATDSWTLQGRYSQPGSDPDDIEVAQTPHFSADGLVLYFADYNRNSVKFWSRPSVSSTVFTFNFAYGTPGFDITLGEFFGPQGTWLSDDQLTLVVVDYGNSVVGTFTRPSTSTQTWTYSSQLAFTPPPVGYPTDVAEYDDEFYFTFNRGDAFQGYGRTCVD